ncbi:uncharacterized protein LOC118749494 [Rhagoletis pomonella]|uniref:uncharacterized protein LOC118749494 n=1 Tax=Rhagoletis pomonella TaxID=28610 RepID=UPI001782A98D|nr:uncharacterized protein LOC118749494 [Rhagoletis pomonella]
MTSGDKIHHPEELDDLITAEIPGNHDLGLRELVLKWMIHNPCGTLNPNAAYESAALGEQMYQLLTEKQKEVANTILQAVSEINSEGKCFFIDGPGGTGKTFIYKTLFYVLTGKQCKVKCMAFTGIASILLPNGRTAHKTFGLKVPLSPGSVSSITPGSPKASKLAETDIFLMDEAPMHPKYGLKNIDQLLRSIANPNVPFGGKIMVLEEDFRQCLPVQPRTNQSELLDLSIKRCPLWLRFKVFTLEENMRVDIEQREFAEYLLKLGNGERPLNTMEEIELPDDIISNSNLIDEVNHGREVKTETVLAALDPNVLARDVIASLPQNDRFEYVWQRIIEHFADSEQRRLNRVLSELPLENKKPSELFFKMKRVTGNALGDTALKSPWIKRLPEFAQTVVAASSGTATEFT